MPRTRKQAANGTLPSSNNDSAPSRSQSSDSLHPPPPGPLSIIITDEEREVIKINNANVSELKNACDDALKRVSALSLFFNVYFITRLFSFCRDRICSSNNTCIRMYGLH
jgi:signal peptidase complex subunit 2